MRFQLKFAYILTKFIIFIVNKNKFSNSFHSNFKNINRNTNFTKIFLKICTMIYFVYDYFNIEYSALYISEMQLQSTKQL